MEAFDVRKIPYFDIEDTIAEVEISRRQLSHWLDQGLLKRELASDTNKFTVTDIRRLKALKHLIVDQKLPIPLVKELVEGGVEHGVTLARLFIETTALFSGDQLALIGKVFDFDAGKLVDKKDLFHHMWYESTARASEQQLERNMYDFALLLFRVVRSRLRTPAAFAERRDEILSEISQLADVARVEVGVWPDSPEGVLYYWNPTFQGEEDISKDMITNWFFLRAKRLNKYRDALQERIESGSVWASQFASRFWSSEELSAVADLRRNSSKD